MSTPSIRVLHVDDDAALLDIAATFVERANENLDVATETDPQRVLDRLDGVDCLVSDYDMPRLNGLELLERVRAEHPDLPFVLFTGTRTGDVAGDALAAGATDVCLKQTGTDHYRILAHRIETAVERRHERDRLEAECAQLRSVLSMAVDELQTGVEEADQRLEALETAAEAAETTADLRRINARFRAIASELEALDERSFLRSSVRHPMPADD